MSISRVTTRVAEIGLSLELIRERQNRVGDGSRQAGSVNEAFVEIEPEGRVCRPSARAPTQPVGEAARGPAGSRLADFISVR
jgi:hypothetical protein